jgi:hypothetical protein
MADAEPKKRKKSISPTQRSLALLRKAGLTVAIVEHWNQYAHIRQDLFGIGDLLALDPWNEKITLVQTTTAANQAARRTKIVESENARVWLKSGGEIVVHGWAKKGPRGAVKHWACTVTPILAVDFPGVDGVERTEITVCEV